MGDDRLAETFAALERGEAPGSCPYCGDGLNESDDDCHTWKCGSDAYNDHGWAISRTDQCYEREIALLQESRRAQECISRQLQTRLAAALAEHARLCEAMCMAASQIARGMEIDAEATLRRALGMEEDE
jgi:hypothetical protein